MPARPGSRGNRGRSGHPEAIEVGGRSPMPRAPACGRYCLATPVGLAEGRGRGQVMMARPPRAEVASEGSPVALRVTFG